MCKKMKFVKGENGDFPETSVKIRVFLKN